MKIVIRKILGPNNQEIGSIVSASVPKALTKDEKLKIEKLLIDYAHSKLYNGQGLHIYRDVNDDHASISVLLNINNMEQSMVDLD